VGEHLPVPLLVHAHGHEERDVADGPRPPCLEVGRVEVEVRVGPVEPTGAPLRERRVEPPGDPAHGVLRDLDPGELPGDLLDLPRRDPLEVHLKDGLLHRTGHPAVPLEHLREEGELAGPWDADLLDVAGLGGEAARVVPVAVAAPAGRPLAVSGLELGVHLLLHDLLKDGLDALADTVLDGELRGGPDLVRGHVSLGWLIPQDPLHDLRPLPS